MEAKKRQQKTLNQSIENSTFSENSIHKPTFHPSLYRWGRPEETKTTEDGGWGGGGG
jgi:hypothetical protein